jgi:hypothetical protein
MLLRGMVFKICFKSKKMTKKRQKSVLLSDLFVLIIGRRSPEASQGLNKGEAWSCREFADGMMQVLISSGNSEKSHGNK